MRMLLMALPSEIAGHRTIAHGVEHFGQTGMIGDLYRHFGLDRQALIRSIGRLTPGAPIV